MTSRPDSMPVRPTPPTDPLSEALRTVHFTRAIYYTVEAGRPWPAIQVPAGAELAPSLGARTRTVVSYHVVVEGECLAALDGASPGASATLVPLTRGDVVVFPRGDPYFLAHDASRPPGGPADTSQLRGLLAGLVEGTAPLVVTGGTAGGERTRFVCGFLGSDAPPFSPLLDALPRLLVVRQPGGRLGRLVELALAELDGAGAASVRERLSESMFLETVRSHLAQGDARWLGGLADPAVGRAISLIHDLPASPWTLATLAHESGVSRSILAERFAALVGQPPMRYLASWRMHVAADLLRRPETTVAEAAHAVGYDSEAAFSRAFKRASGVPPRSWRELDASS